MGDVLGKMTRAARSETVHLDRRTIAFERLALFPMVFAMFRGGSEENNRNTPDIRPHGLATEFSPMFDQRIVSTILRNCVAQTRRRDMSQTSRLAARRANSRPRNEPRRAMWPKLLVRWWQCWLVFGGRRIQSRSVPQLHSLAQLLKLAPLVLAKPGWVNQGGSFGRARKLKG